MVDNNLIVIGVLLGAHGVRGDCRVKSFTELPEDAFAYGPLLGEDSQVLVTPTKARTVKDHFIVTPEEALQKEAWDGLKGTRLYVPRDALPPAEEGEIYIEELVGLTVLDGAGVGLGTVKAVHDFGAGDLLEIAPPENGKSVMVPFTKEDVPDVDLEAGQLTVASFDLWADESGSSEQTNTADSQADKRSPTKKLKR